MKLARPGVVEGREEKGEEKRFSKLKPLADSLKRATVVVAILAGASFSVHCGGGPDPAPTDGGDGGSMVDSGPTNDGGNQDSGTPDSGPGPGLCTQYPSGSPNNNTFQGGNIMRPANSSGWLWYFKSLKIQNGTEYASFGLYPSDLSSPIQYQAFTAGQTKTVNVPGVGNVTFQLCAMTAQECNAPVPGQPPNSGDVNCTATLAADQPWGQ